MEHSSSTSPLEVTMMRGLESADRISCPKQEIDRKIRMKKYGFKLKCIFEVYSKVVFSLSSSYAAPQ